MDLRARINVPETTGSGRPPRRITCKYLVPLLPSEETVEVCQKAFVSAFVITTKRVRLQREKLISSLGLNSYSSHNRAAARSIENNNNTSKKSSPSAEQDDNEDDEEPVDLTGPEPKSPELPSRKGPRKPVDNPLIPFGLLVPDGVTIAPVTASPDHDRDIAIVHNFFSNQLWKPEYIGTYS